MAAMSSIIKKIVIFVLLMVLTLPLSMVVTVFTFPFWRWLDEVSGIESFGHSGPAEWCYWLVYCVLLCAGLLVWYWLRQDPDEN